MKNLHRLSISVYMVGHYFAVDSVRYYAHVRVSPAYTQRD